MCKGWCVGFRRVDGITESRGGGVLRVVTLECNLLPSIPMIACSSSSCERRPSPDSSNSRMRSWEKEIKGGHARRRVGVRVVVLLCCVVWHDDHYLYSPSYQYLLVFVLCTYPDFEVGALHVGDDLAQGQDSAMVHGARSLPLLARAICESRCYRRADTTAAALLPYTLSGVFDFSLPKVNCFSLPPSNRCHHCRFDLSLSKLEARSSKPMALSQCCSDVPYRSTTNRPTDPRLMRGRSACNRHDWPAGRPVGRSVGNVRRADGARSAGA